MPLPKNVTKTLYKSLVQPLFDYCDVAWSPGMVYVMSFTFGSLLAFLKYVESVHTLFRFGA